MLRVSYVLIALTTAIVGCGRNSNPTETPERLSAYGLFAGRLADLRPAPGVQAYELTTPLFSDYADKARHFRIPEGTSVRYRAEGPLDFPVGTVLAKTFSYPHDARKPEAGRRLIETRLLIRREEGWIALPYVWNDDQTDAALEVAGGTFDASWIDASGDRRTNNYIIPNVNQCKGCHEQGEGIEPIGPRARFLHKVGPNGSAVDQLSGWVGSGVLLGAPPLETIEPAPTADDPTTGSLDARARTWLDINCAHCHNPNGPAKSAGLDLRLKQERPLAFGVMKPPVAAGLGSGGRSFDIVPGDPEASILTYRIGSTHPGIMMPELGKRLVHVEGVELIRSWIAAMPKETGR